MKATKTTLKHMRRTPYQSLAAVSMMVLTFLSITIFAFIVFGSSAVIKYFESKPQVTAFFKDEAKPEEIQQLAEQLKQTGKVSETKYVSKEQALQIYKEQNKSDPLLLELVTADVLPASLEVSSYNIEDLGTIAQTLRSSPLVLDGEEGVIHHPEVIKQLSSWTNAIRIIGILLIIVLTTVSVFIMMTVIGFKVSQKKDEIEIMKLLSATNSYIRMPFILEGVFYGLIGTFVGWIFATGALLYATPFLQTFLGTIPILPVSPLFLIAILVGELVIAVLLGILASSLAVFRYLK